MKMTSSINVLVEKMVFAFACDYLFQQTVTDLCVNVININMSSLL